MTNDSVTEKKKYESPKVFRVVLNHDQAILSGCSTAATRVNATTNTQCKSGCRRGGSNGANQNSGS